MSKKPFNVSLPIEVVERWIKDEGINDGMISENQEVLVDNLVYNQDTGYVDINGDLSSHLDS